MAASAHSTTAHAARVPQSGAPSWTMVVKDLAILDAATSALEDDYATMAPVCEAARIKRQVMWATPAPTLADLVWKLERAIIYEDLEDDTSHPLNAVLRDLRSLAGVH